ncbi:hypothetical protein CcaverHIS002_0401000 [Cutaneotrichosporon cavernicola]|uniref:Succinate dehydrogenase assembly factor 2, mitochondrial n=1 Tax=Cutaneotrichosporon cavernicola TaxID=279322 RepID=A0AA48QVJ4_9TREE|nr:uncharacterized protein CcaverHIS019_0400970 [Cutaneotrichosporon cavernicola]BEI83496.1 hypothetical protein CcaverHIS002_0401000 [Cutaneotrichosporon cavernicola]BEI91277.1 hypothetical protein CcaverHIS019_0400970 [Cutaneotrichosporon cavernicola]BEI99050.1 hypothetical protein CcaverHIS631_0400930 [Cutaneotrichosporon cavernicola]BEJ06824.1 hypothetical protein CcaverHIS641_0400930 [Cutaneotrichosporon cavernicola]
MSLRPTLSLILTPARRIATSCASRHITTSCVAAARLSNNPFDPFPRPFDPPPVPRGPELTHSRGGESSAKLRARLTYQSRKRSSLESGLLLSTFARDFLPGMTTPELREFDRLLAEPDADIYSWAVGKRDAPSRWNDSAVLDKLRKHARNENKVVRRTPDLEDIER